MCLCHWIPKTNKVNSTTVLTSNKHMHSIRLVYLMILAAAIAGCEKKHNDLQAETKATVVEVTTVKSLQPSLPIVLPGELKAWSRAQIVAKVKGYVSKLYVDRGSNVRKGQSLVDLE